jgi:integrase
MTTAVSSAALATIQPVFTDAERIALAGFPAGYRGLTREAYALDLRQVTSWCRARSCPCPPSAARTSRASPGTWRSVARPRHSHPEAVHHRRLLQGTRSKKNSLGTSPAVHVRRPRVDDESHAVALDCNELGALLVAAGLGSPAEHALISLLALNGLRVSEAIGADIEHLGLERGHRALTITRAARSSPSRSPRGPRGRSTWPSGSAP